MRKYSYQTGNASTFTSVDYVLFAAVLSISAGIGIFFAIKDRKKQTTVEFLLAGGNMHVLPVAVSMLASFMSAITVLGTPAEIYSYGTLYLWVAVSYIFAIFFAAHVYIPVFYRLGVTSCYEYLQLRFGSIARVAGALTYVVQMTVYMACVLYAPSLALNAVTGFPLWGSVWAVGVVCTFYTALGGMKTVLWTDTFQVIVMITGLLAIVVQGSIEVDGFMNALEVSSANGRIHFTDFSVNPSVRHSVWSLVIGGAFLWTFVYGTNQAQVQRAVTCPTLKKAQLAMWINVPGLALMLFLSAVTGILAYVFYKHCDPTVFGTINDDDQLLPLFVMDVLGHIKGIPGLFVACLFSGALSTISSGLNSISAVVLEDIIRKISPNMTERTATRFTKGLGLVFGSACIGLTYIAALSGEILQTALAFFGMIGGPILGIFTLGMLFPWANQSGAVAGLISSLALMFWIGVGFVVHKPTVDSQLPVEIHGCNWTSAKSSAGHFMRQENYDDSPLTKLYTLSYMWYAATAVLVVVVVGMLVSLITGRNKPSDSDPSLFCPLFDVLFPYLPEKIRKPLRFGVDYSKMKISDVNPNLTLDSEMEYDKECNAKEEIVKMFTVDKTTNNAEGETSRTFQ